MQETMINLRNSTQSQPAVERDTASKGKKRGGKKWFLIFVILILLVGGGIVGFSKYKKSRNNFIDPAKYQAVFLSNGQVYFGKVSIAQEGYVSLNEVYYLVNNKPLQDQQNANGGAADQAKANPDYSLIKLGREIHGPENMEINPPQILFIENLNNDSKLVNAIKNMQK